MSMSVSVSVCESVRESIFPKLHIQSSHFCARLAVAMHFLYYVTGLSASKRTGGDGRRGEAKEGRGQPPNIFWPRTAPNYVTGLSAFNAYLSGGSVCGVAQW